MSIYDNETTSKIEVCERIAKKKWSDLIKLQVS